MTRAIALALMLGLTALAPRAADAAEAGDAVFAERGPWDLGDRVLEWALTVEGPAAEGFRPVPEGRIALSQGIDPSDQQPVLQLTQKAGPVDRRIGPFPISSGDPVLTFFLEQTTRDMAALTGGSPFYIRNRMKEALFRGGDLARTEDGVTASFRPFAEDPNAPRMNGFQSLTLTFVMAEPEAPIRELRAETAEGATYRNRMVLQ
ncbi:hypothetical protein [Paracoccus sp. ME4]|uniref:hypothetical protein n=1 Tax=Paracoccus sp. ME4 TaxID=3138066 RepID=UPI00398B14F9